MNRKDSDSNLFLKIEALRSRLKEIIFDQDIAIDEVADAFMHMVYKPAETPPKAIFTFLGPPAAGKVFFARSLAGLLEGYQNIKTFDMGQYADPADAPRLVGYAPFEGDLIKFLKAHPRSIVLFEEIEKADNQLQLELLELITGKVPESGVDCSETIIIFTSTLGAFLYKSREFMQSFKTNKLYAQALTIEAISKEMKMVFDTYRRAIEPKLLAAMAQHTIVLFKRLSLDSIVRIGAESLSQQTQHFIANTGIQLKYETFEALVKLMTLSFAPYINPQRIQQKLPDAVFYQITQYVRDNQSTPGTAIYAISSRASDFLENIYIDSEALAQALAKKNETVELSWKVETQADIVNFTIEKAKLKKIPPSKAFLREERPRVEYSTIGFEDIAGNKSTKKTLKQIIRIIKEPELVKKFEIDMPKGMLLYGPKGVGKTMLGKAFAKEAELPLIFISGMELFEPEAIRGAYRKAKQLGSCVVFLDEIDIKGIVEGVFTHMSPEPLITELDALPSDPEELIFTIATAKEKAAIHPDIIAPGRIDMFVEVPDLDREARRFFIEKILEKPNDGKIDVDKVVRYISGMNGNDLQRIGKEASLYALRNNLDRITEEILIEQINIIKYGFKLEKKHIRNLEEDLKKTAYHEAGHAVLSYLLLPDIKIEQVTIAPRIETLGFVSYSLEDFATNVTKEEVFNNICVMLAGRVTQMKKFGRGGIDTGTSNDLEQATYQAYFAIANLGMDDELGFINIDTLSQNINRRIFQQKIEERLIHWIAAATEKTRKLVDLHMDKIEKLAGILLKKEIVDGSELEAIMKS